METTFIVQTNHGMCKYRSLKKAVMQNIDKYIMCSNAQHTILSQRQGCAIVDMVDKLLISSFGNRITKIILYGSTARGDYKASSDIDFLVCTSGVSKTDWLDFVGGNRTLYKYNIDFDIHQHDGDNIENESLTYYKNIRKDGIIIWQKD